jgi:hypothetical protein
MPTTEGPCNGMHPLISELSCAVLSPSRHRLQMKVPEIKKILKAKGLPRTGSKADLIATYLSNVGMTTLTCICLMCVLCWWSLGFTTCRCHRNNYAGRAGGDAG